MEAISPTRNFGHATQRKIRKLIAILEALQKDGDMSSVNLQALFGSSQSGMRNTMRSLVEENVVLELKPTPRKTFYRISPDKKLVYAKIKSLEALASIALLPMRNKNNSGAKLNVVERNTSEPISFRIGELQMRLFPETYKNFISLQEEHHADP